MAIQLFVVAISTAWLVRLMSTGLHYLKWIGIIYLLYLAIYHLIEMFGSEGNEIAISYTVAFRRGFLVALTNPKTLLFFSAFVPQFVSSSGNYNFQIFLLALSFLAMAIILDSCDVLLASKLLQLTKERYLDKFRDGFSGLLYLCACAWLATTKRLT